ncbi:MAG: hypothetical protein ACHWZW_13150 [Spirulina sp.]
MNIAIAAATRQVILQLKKQGHSASEAPTLSVAAKPERPTLTVAPSSNSDRWAA